MRRHSINLTQNNEINSLNGVQIRKKYAYQV